MPMVRNSLFVLALVSMSGCQSILGLNLHDAETPKQSAVENTSNEQSALLLAELSTASGLKLGQDNENHAQQVLENNFTQQKSEWIDELNSVVLSVTPTRTFIKNERHCREYKAVITQGKREIAINTTACRHDNGMWMAL